MTSFTRFQERNKKRTVAQTKFNTNFIFNGYPSIKIKGSADQEIQASLVNKQEKDYAYIFTQLQDELSIGSIWTAKNLHLLVTEEITIIKDVNWHKYHALLCNVQIDDQWGYFKGPEESYINVKLEKEVVWESPQKPILVLPENVLDFRDKIVIKGRAWLIQEYDAISTPGLIYYSLKPTTISKDAVQNKEVYVEKFEEPDINFEEPVETLSLDGVVKVKPDTLIELETENGYLKCSNKVVKILRRTDNLVTISIPFGVNEVTIKTKKKGNIVETTYCTV